MSDPPAKETAVPSKRRRAEEKKQEGEKEDAQPGPPTRSGGGVSRFKYGGARRGEKVTILEFLTKRFPYFSAQQWEDRMSKGWMRVQPGGEGPEVTAEPGYCLTQGDLLVLDTPREEEPEVDDKIEVLFQDEESDLVGVSKSGNLPVSESGKYRKNCLGCILEERLHKPVWSMHRLDKETSGCVLLALSDTAARRVASCFAGGAVRKLYHAVLRGEMQAPTETSCPIGPFWRFTGEEYCRDMPSMKKIRWAPAPAGRESEGKACRTLFTPLRVAGGLTLAQVEI